MHAHTIEVVNAAGETLQLSLTGDLRADVANAIDAEHGDCTDSACDIREAADAGFSLTAAHLLLGATEAPVLDAVLAEYLAANELPPEENPYIGFSMSEEFDWRTHHETYGFACDACGAYTYGGVGYEPEHCGNCLAALERTWLVAIVVPIGGKRGPTDAWERESDPGGALDVDGSLYVSGPIDCEPRDIDNPDFYAVVRSHGRELQRADEM